MYTKDAFEGLANSLRILLEVNFRAGQGLMKLDPEEAVGNIDHALTAALNSYSSMCDALVKEGVGTTAYWYSVPEVALILILRNARHHNHARKIRTIYNHYMEKINDKCDPQTSLMVDFVSNNDEGDNAILEVYQSWGDLKSLFSMPKKITKIQDGVEKSVLEYINSSGFERYEFEYGVPAENIFFNVVPLLVNAGVMISKSAVEKIENLTSDGATFLEMFSSEASGFNARKHKLKIAEATQV